VLGARYVMYGEWLYAKHTVFYDRLPHYFMEFDVLDLHTGAFLSTPRRRALLQPTPVVSVPVLHAGTTPSIALARPGGSPRSTRATGGARRCAAAASGAGLAVERVEQETDPTPLSEGLYIKVEEGGEVTGRYKWVRPSFLTAVVDSGSHWLDRPIVPNRLAPGSTSTTSPSP
jgi:hypothetical protein